MCKRLVGLKKRKAPVLYGCFFFAGIKTLVYLIAGTKITTDLFAGIKIVAYLFAGTKITTDLIAGIKIVAYLFAGTKINKYKFSI